MGCGLACDAPAWLRAWHRDAGRVGRQIEAELPLGHDTARAVLGERLKLDLAVVEGEGRAGSGNQVGVVLHVRDQHIGQIELVDLGLPGPIGHADQRRTVEVLACRRERQQRRQARIAVQRERQRRESGRLLRRRSPRSMSKLLTSNQPLYFELSESPFKPSSARK